MIQQQHPLRLIFVRMRVYPWRAIVFFILLAFLSLNLLAYMHARAMLQFSEQTARTPSPQSLSLAQKITVLLCGVTVSRPSNSRKPEDVGLPAKTTSITTDDGVRLETWLIQPVNPKGTVVLFHGYASSRADLLEQAKVCHGLGWATMLVDFRGSGGSDGNTTSLGYHEAKDVQAAVRLAKDQGLARPLVLYGQSMGGAAVLRSIAALDVQPDGIILESVFDRMHETVRNRFHNMGMPSFAAAELLVFWGGVQIGCSGFAHNPADYACSCDCPTLLLHGSDDHNTTVDNGRAVYCQLAGSKKMVVFEGVGHTSLCSADPKQWTSVVGEFLTEQKKRWSKSKN